MAADGYLHGVLADGARGFRYRPGVARLLGHVPDDLSLRFVASPYAPSFPYMRPPTRRDHAATLTAVRGDGYGPTVYMEAEAPQWSYATDAAERHAPPPHADVELQRAAPRAEPERIRSDSAQVARLPDSAEAPPEAGVPDPIVIPPAAPVTHVRVPAQQPPGRTTATPPSASASAATYTQAPPPPTMTAPSGNGVPAPNPPPPVVGPGPRVEPIDESTVAASTRQSRPAPATDPPTTATDVAAMGAVATPPSRSAVEYPTLPPRSVETSVSAPLRDVSRARAARPGVRVDPPVSAGAVGFESWDVTTDNVVDAAPIAAAEPSHSMASEPIFVVDGMNAVVVPAFWARRHLNRLRPRLLR